MRNRLLRGVKAVRNIKPSEQKIHQNTWLIYGAEKRKLTALNLSPEEYEIKVRKLLKELRL